MARTEFPTSVTIKMIFPQEHKTVTYIWYDFWITHVAQLSNNY